MKQLFTLSIYLLILTLAFPSDTGAATVKGRLFDQAGVPVQGQVITMDRNVNSVTDTQGHFEFNHVTAGIHDIEVKTENDFLIITRITVKADQDVDLGNMLMPVTHTLKEVEISDTYSQQHFDHMKNEEGQVIYAGKKSEVLLIDHIDANKAQNNPRQILGRIPGMNFSETEGAGFPSNGFGLRGLNPTQSVEMNVRQNGYNITADLFGYNEAYYNPALEAVERIEVIRGASSLQFGPQFGGVVNFVMKKAPSDKKIEYTMHQTVGSYGLINSFHSFGGTIKKFDYYTYIQYKQMEGWRPNSGSNSLMGYAHVGYRFNSKLKAALEYSHLQNTIQMAGGLSDAQYEMDNRQSFRSRNWLNSPWHVLAFNLDYAITPNTSVSLKTTYLFSERNLVWKNEDGGPEQPDSIDRATNQYVAREVEHEDFKSITNELRFSTRYVFLNMPNTLVTGIRSFEGKMKRQGGGPGSSGSDFDLNLYGGGYEYDLDFRTSNTSWFTENIFRITSKFSVIPGIRYEHIASSSKGYITDGGVVPSDFSRTRNFLLAGLGMQCQASKTTSLYANISQAYRPMDYSALVPVGVTSKIDPSLKDATGYNADLGWRGSLGKIINFDAGLFYLSYMNRVGLLSMTDASGNPYTLRTNTGNSVSRGMESYVEWNPVKMFTDFSRMGQVHIYHSLAYVDAKYTSGTDEHGNSLRGNKVEYAPDWIERFGITYGIRNFSITYQFSYTSHSFGDANNTLSSEDAVVGLIPAYKVMDLSATYKMGKLAFRAGINNITNEKYFTKRTDEYPGPGIIPSLGRSFNLGVSAKF